MQNRSIIVDRVDEGINRCSRKPLVSRRFLGRNGASTQCGNFSRAPKALGNFICNAKHLDTSLGLDAFQAMNQ